MSDVIEQGEVAEDFQYKKRVYMPHSTLRTQRCAKEAFRITSRWRRTPFLIISTPSDPNNDRPNRQRLDPQKSQEQSNWRPLCQDIAHSG
jgi:hypothetical protein